MVLTQGAVCTHLHVKIVGELNWKMEKGSWGFKTFTRLGKLAKTEETVKRMPLELQENNRPFFLRGGEAASSLEVGAVEQEVGADVIPVRQNCWVVRGLVKVGNRWRQGVGSNPRLEV
ncbi:hypothetical protein SELMODRAFT_415442 [Selaginella moellendorffii]|uniref:Uncharacterized protein n=1 Tax=Selaginella moellendorffii TaxID=88036 RepID=D8RW49_SELML|nr:hypothetical protein SELMODRAFT_415442 [Selaginella moellendorffii]